MKTYQDLFNLSEDEDERMAFVRQCIMQHKGTEQYKTAWTADQYNRHKNVTINEYQKILYTVSGRAIPDVWSANFKMACRHFHRFVVQENQYLLGNGVSWENESTKDKLGTSECEFDTQLSICAKSALVHGVSFGFFNLDHLDVFSLLEFVPLYDEENGSMRAGIRFWQVEPSKPLRATLYEEDGYTDYIWIEGKGEVLNEKRAYKLKVAQNPTDGERIYDEENYPSFPIVPLWANSEHQSEIVGLREQIDCYDLIKSGYANTVDEASIVYWTIQNAGGMDDVDLAKFVERMKTLHAATTDDMVNASSHTQDAPFASREALLERLDRDLYRDAMALNTDFIAGGATTATQIKAAYEPLNSKTDDFEYQVITFVKKILALAGVEDVPTFTRSILINSSETIQSILQCAQFLPKDYVVSKVLQVLGDGDKVEDVLKQLEQDEIDRIASIVAEATQPENNEV